MALPLSTIQPVEVYSEITKQNFFFVLLKILVEEMLIKLSYLGQ